MSQVKNDDWYNNPLVTYCGRKHHLISNPSKVNTSEPKYRINRFCAEFFGWTEKHEQGKRDKSVARFDQP